MIGNSFKIESRNGELCIKCLSFFVCLFVSKHWIGTTIEEHAYTILGTFGCVVANVWVGFSDLYFISTIHTIPLSWQTEWNRMVEDSIWGSYSVVSNLWIIAHCQFYSFLDEFLFLGMIWVSENGENPISRESHYYGHGFKWKEWVGSEKTCLTLLIHAFHIVPIWSSTFLLWAKQVDYSLHCIPDQLLQ